MTRVLTTLLDWESCRRRSNTVPHRADDIRTTSFATKVTGVTWGRSTGARNSPATASSGVNLMPNCSLSTAHIATEITFHPLS